MNNLDNTLEKLFKTVPNDRSLWSLNTLITELHNKNIPDSFEKQALHVVSTCVKTSITLLCNSYHIIVPAVLDIDEVRKLTWVTAKETVTAWEQTFTGGMYMPRIGIYPAIICYNEFDYLCQKNGEHYGTILGNETTLLHEFFHHLSIISLKANRPGELRSLYEPLYFGKLEAAAQTWPDLVINRMKRLGIT